MAAGVYAARKKISTVLVAESFGGQSVVSADIRNWIGDKSISGLELSARLEAHLRGQEGIEIIGGDRVVLVEDKGECFSVSTKSGKNLEAEYLLVASGSRRRRLNIPGEDKFDGKGVAYCSICDAPMFGGKNVAVIGGGNAGLEAATDLLPYAEKIYLLERDNQPRGDQVTQEKLGNNPKVTFITGAETLEIIGTDFVSSIKYKNLANNEIKELPVGGVFVEIGAVSNSEFLNKLVEINGAGEIVADPRTEKTSHPRIWAVGDVTDVLYKQNNISAGDAIKALLNIFETIQKNS